jgi:hypothetical protein
MRRWFLQEHSLLAWCYPSRSCSDSDGFQAGYGQQDLLTSDYLPGAAWSNQLKGTIYKA